MGVFFDNREIASVFFVKYPSDTDNKKSPLKNEEGTFCEVGA
jgi:hypothetical protein